MGTADGARAHSWAVIPDLTDRRQLSAFLNRHQLSARKRLGQHWLCSKPVVQALTAAASPAASFLEIGPGAGVMTQRLSENGRTIAIELDARMASALAKSAPNAEVLIQDVLKSDLGALLARLKRPRAVVSNLPYVITSPVLEMLDVSRDAFDCAVLLMQKEVAEKILAQPEARNRGSLSVIMQRRFEISKVCSAPPSAFMPPPKVHSIGLKLIPRINGDLTQSQREFIKAAFRYPRKMLVNNLAQATDRSAVLIQFDRLGLNPLCRPQELTEVDWLRLEEALRTRAH